MRGISFGKTGNCQIWFDSDFWHVGESGEAGFDILRILRERSERNFQPISCIAGDRSNAGSCC